MKIKKQSISAIGLWLAGGMGALTLRSLIDIYTDNISIVVDYEGCELITWTDEDETVYHGSVKDFLDDQDNWFRHDPNQQFEPNARYCDSLGAYAQINAHGNIAHLVESNPTIPIVETAIKHRLSRPDATEIQHFEPRF